jgi:hypothetical protein
VNGIASQVAIGVRLYFRNTTALVYGFLFPVIFLVAFAVLYRHEDVPLARHMGELLTVTALGGACFGLPTTLVSERERGVWRRYRLVPVPTAVLVTATVVTRYVLLIPAALLQLAIAIAIGMPLPQHPLDLWLAFTCVAFAFLGLGLVIAMMADTVPAVQALGQSIFLPMLIIGGVAVPLASLPEWAQRVSSFFPGRYAVQALQTSVTGRGLGDALFSVGALILVGVAGCVAGAAMFRWDAQQRFLADSRKAWVAVAVAAWIVVGLLADPSPRTGLAAPASVPAPAAMPPAAAGKDLSPAKPEPEPRPVAEASKAAKPEARRTKPASWRTVTLDDVERDIDFDQLPPDAGVVAPIAGPDDQPDASVIKQLVQLRRGLEEWAPAQVPDPAQRVRNYLYVAAVPDVFQIPLERFAPLLIFDRLQKEFDERDLVRLLYWVARHPAEGDDSALGELHRLGLGAGPSDIEQTRERVVYYAVKLLGRLTGKIAAG